MSAKVLLVDDAQELLDAYVLFVQGMTSHDVRGATSGGAALEIARRWRPDIVVTDIMMSEMNGLELITRIRSELPPPLPVIVAMSGFPDVEREALRRGAQVFQVKPLDPDDLVVLIDALLQHRAPPRYVRAVTDARRHQASALAESAVSATLGRQPYFAQVAQLGTRLMSRYFDDTNAALLLIGDGRLKVFASSGWPVGTQPEGVVGYALDVVMSGSTLIVPDLAAMPTGSVRTTVPDWRLLAAVPVCSDDGTAIGALMIADRRTIRFDVHDLGMLQHIASCLGDVFSGDVGGAGVLEGAGVLRGETWRHALGCELSHLAARQTLVMALASSAMPAMIPVESREQMDDLEQATTEVIARLPPRTALGCVSPERLAAYSMVDDAVAGTRRLVAILQSLAPESRGVSIATIAATDIAPTDRGAALLEILHCLLASAIARGPDTVLGAEISPTLIDARRAA